MRKQLARILTIAMILHILAVAPFALGATYYVGPTGSDSNPGTSSQPFRTIQKAANVVQAGDTVNVMPGDYSNVTSNASGAASARIRFVSSSKWGAKIYSSSSYGWVNNGAYVDIDGFDITGGPSVRIGILSWASNVRISNNYVHDLTSSNLCSNSNGGAGIDHAEVNSTGNETIGNTVHHIGLGCTGGTNPGIHGIYQASPNSIVANNVIHDVRNHGIVVYKSGGAPGGVTIFGNMVYNADVGISSINGSGNKIYNNIVRNIGCCALRIKDSSSIWANNTVYASGVGIEIGSSGNTIRNNIAYQNGTNISGGSGNTLSNNLNGTDPKFVNAGGGDFRLQSTSPAINAGTAVSEVTADFGGVARPQGSAYDIGAYEYVSSGTSLIAPSNLSVNQ
jgi:parallel beta-helix repeat protein